MSTIKNSMLTIAYRKQLVKLSAKTVQGFNTTLKYDALQEAWLSLQDKDLSGKSQVDIDGLLSIRMKSKMIDGFKHEDIEANNVIDWRENAKPAKNYEAFRSQAVKVLHKNQIEILDYVLSGYKVKEIAEVLGMLANSVTKALRRIIVRLGLFFINLDVSLEDSGKSYFTESDLIYMIDNRESLMENF